MSLVPTIYSSTDPGAPQLSGEAGALTTLLDAILVDGYGSGLDEKAGMGWSREFSATNKRAYKNNAVLGTGQFLRIDDTAAIGNARHAWVRAYSSMEEIDSGTEPNPPLADEVNGALWIKSTTLNGEARPWWAIGNSRSAYLFVASSGLSIEEATPHFAGDIDSRMPADNFRFMVESAGVGAFTGSGSTTASFLFQASNNTSGSSVLGQVGFIARASTGLPGAVRVANISDDHGSASPTGAFGGGGAPYPDPVAGGLILKRVTIKEGSYMFRGFMPGVYVPQQQRPLSEGQLIEDIEDLGGISILGKNFRTRGITSGGASGQVIFVVGREW